MYNLLVVALTALVFYLVPAKKDNKVEIHNPEFEKIERETKDNINQIAVEIAEENKSRSDGYRK